MAAPQLRLLVDESKISIADNTSLVTATLQLYGNGETYSGDTEYGSITINGTKKNFSCSGFSKSRSWQTLGSASVTVAHTSDGSKTITVKGYFDISWSFYGALSTSRTVNLETIPRASEISVSPDSVDAGESVTITVSKKVSSFTHSLTCKIGNASVGIASRISGNKTWTVPLELLEQFTKSASGTAKIYCDTYNGDTYIGTKSVELTINASKEIVPAIESIGITEAVQEISNKFDQFVQGLSQINVSIKANGIFGSTIDSYETTLDGVRYIQKDFTSNNIHNFGEIPIKVMVRDTRGRSATQTINIPVAEYFGPQLDEVSFLEFDSQGRPTPNGPVMGIVVAGRTAAVNDSNFCKIEVKYRNLTSTEYITHVSRIMPANSIDTSYLFPDLLKDESYEFVVTLSDKISSVTKKIENGVTLITLKAGGQKVEMHGEVDFENQYKEPSIINLGVLKRYEKTTTHTLTTVEKQYTKLASIDNLPAGWYLVTAELYGWKTSKITLAIVSINSPSVTNIRTYRRENVWGGGGTAITGVQEVKEGGSINLEVWVNATDSINSADYIKLNAIRLY